MNNILEISELNINKMSVAKKDAREIEINPDEQTVDKKKGFVEKQKERVALGLYQSAAQEVSENWMDKFSCGCEFLKPYFEIDTSDFFKRFFQSLVPFNGYFSDSIEKNPDLWGPFWIYTFLVFVIAACGSIQKYLSNTNLTESFYHKFVPISAGMIYGIGFVLPGFLFITIKCCFKGETSFMTILCTYGYSMSIYIPTVIACTFPLDVNFLYLVDHMVGVRLCSFFINFVSFS